MAFGQGVQLGVDVIGAQAVAAAVVLMVLIVDIIYGFVDPRIQVEKS